MIKEYCEAKGWQLFPICAAAKQGLDPLMTAAHAAVKAAPKDITFAEDYVPPVIDPTQSAPFTVTVLDDDYYVVEGVGVESGGVDGNGVGAAAVG